jgi:hypothetical protein
MTVSTLQLAAAAAFLAAAPVAASADQIAFTNGAPVALATVSDTQDRISLPFGSQNLYLNETSVGFVNGTNVAATNVRFAISRNGKTQLVDARGTFAPGTRVDRLISTGTSILPQANATVGIAKIEFADGSTWTPASGRIASR